MTTLFSWAGIDTHGPASIYIASDSRISWGEQTTWDVGRKLFASKLHPEIFGYCGSVAFPIQILGQLIELIDNNLLFYDNDSVDTKLERVRLVIEKSYNEIPTNQKKQCKILYATRLDCKMSSSFHVARISVNVKSITAEWLNLPEKSGLIVRAGSGRTALKTWHEEWVGNPSSDPHQSGMNSRYVYSAFSDALKSQQDSFSGGAPQLIGLYREGPARSFGIIHKEKRFLNGVEVYESPSFNSIEWRNERFERCCGESMQILKQAQRQPKLRGIKQP